MIDYALPTMLAEKALKEMHDAMLMKNYGLASELVKTAAGHLMDVHLAIHHEKLNEGKSYAEKL